MAVAQSHYRFGINELAEATHGWHANEDANPAKGVIANAVTFLLRFCIQDSVAALSNIDAEFQYRKNGGTWTQITTSSAVIKAVTSILVNGANTTKRLSGTGTFESSSAGCTTDGISGGTAFDIVLNGNGETECSMQIVDADVADNDVIEFRLTRDGGVLLNTYPVTPTLTVSKPGATIIEADGASAGAGSSSVVGRSVFAGVTSAVATAATSVIGAVVFAAVLASSGLGTPAANAVSVFSGSASGAGVAVVASYSISLSTGVASSVGAAVALGEGEEVLSGSVGLADGIATVLGVTEEVVVLASDGEADGSATTEGIGFSFASVIGFAEGTSESLAAACLFAKATISAEGLGTPLATSAAILGADGTCTIGGEGGGPYINLYRGFRIYAGGSIKELCLTDPLDPDAGPLQMQGPSGSRSVIVKTP